MTLEATGLAETTNDFHRHATVIHDVEVERCYFVVHQLSDLLVGPVNANFAYCFGVIARL